LSAVAFRCGVSVTGAYDTTPEGGVTPPTP